MPTAYDHIAYPTRPMRVLNPERLAVQAMLAGLDPVPPGDARILEIGGGDCLNLLAMAAAWPSCDAQGFDLSESAIARGIALAQGAGLGNVSLAVEDILNAARRYPARGFDYVFVHGVYAWVPDVVRRAVMELVGHVLSDRGVALISFNAMPGSHVRCMMREMLLDALQDVEGPAQRCAAARAFLELYRDEVEDDGSLAGVLRKRAIQMLATPDEVLFHDELSGEYHPQLLADVVDAARGQGLAWLGDTGRMLRMQGFVAADARIAADASAADLDRAVLRAATLSDFRAFRAYRASLFVRQSASLSRRPCFDRLSGMWLSTQLEALGGSRFRLKERTLELGNAAFAAGLERAIAIRPQRVPAAELVGTNSAACEALATLFNEGMVNLYSAPAPFAAAVDEKPRSSPLVRAMLEQGLAMVCNLDHTTVQVEQPELRALLKLADGTRTFAEMAAMQDALPVGEIRAVLDSAARMALLC